MTKKGLVSPDKIKMTGISHQERFSLTKKFQFEKELCDVVAI